jgi:hypothetical protein
VSSDVSPAEPDNLAAIERAEQMSVGPVPVTPGQSYDVNAYAVTCPVCGSRDAYPRPDPTDHTCGHSIPPEPANVAIRAGVLLAIETVRLSWLLRADELRLKARQLPPGGLPMLERVIAVTAETLEECAAELRAAATDS